MFYENTGLTGNKQQSLSPPFEEPPSLSDFLLVGALVKETVLHRDPLLSLRPPHMAGGPSGDDPAEARRQNPSLPEPTEYD